MTETERAVARASERVEGETVTWALVPWAMAVADSAARAAGRAVGE